MTLTPPPTIDPAFYRAGDPALAGLDDEAAIAHYRAHGRDAGRAASPLALRENLLAFVPAGSRVLEIGPFLSPLMRGDNVHYLDILDAEGLRRRALEIGRNPAGVPEHIHHVGGMHVVDQVYDILLSSHSIEHQPDLVGHLQQVERILAPGGAYFLIIPDKRYCFDHFIAESTIADVLQAWHEKRTRHTIGSLIQHRALVTHNIAPRHWNGDHGKAQGIHAAHVQVAIDEFARADGGYIDVHAWYFTPPAFRTIMRLLNELGLVRLQATGIYHPAFGRNEFCAILQRPDVD